MLLPVAGCRSSWSDRMGDEPKTFESKRNFNFCSFANSWSGLVPCICNSTLMSASVQSHREAIKAFGAILEKEKEKKSLKSICCEHFLRFLHYTNRPGRFCTLIVSSRGEVLLSHLMFVKSTEHTWYVRNTVTGDKEDQHLDCDSFTVCVCVAVDKENSAAKSRVRHKS